MGWLWALIAIVVIIFIIYGLWSFFSGVSMTNSSRRQMRADAEIAEKENENGRRITQDIDFNNNISRGELSGAKHSNHNLSKTQELKNLSELKKDGHISDEEFQSLKDDIINK